MGFSQVNDPVIELSVMSPGVLSTRFKKPLMEPRFEYKGEWMAISPLGPMKLDVVMEDPSEVFPATVTEPEKLTLKLAKPLPCGMLKTPWSPLSAKSIPME